MYREFALESTREIMVRTSGGNYLQRNKTKVSLKKIQACVVPELHTLKVIAASSQMTS